MAKKYLPGGALNPAWCHEQDVAQMTESIMDTLNDLFASGVAMELNLELSEGISVKIPNNQTQEVVRSNDYEEIFQFLSRHRDTPEDLELAMKIIGLK